MLSQGSVSLASTPSERFEAQYASTNRSGWEGVRMVLVYRHRWTGTETVQRDGKPQLGLGACQVRTSEGQTRHVSLVSTV